MRRLVDPLAERIPVPIVDGVNRGRWWSLASAGHGYATGRRATHQMNVLSALVEQGDVVWDVGAHHGYMTLCVAARAGSSGRVHAFEPSARNHALLDRHVRWNRLDQVSVHAHALSSFDGESSLGGGPTSKSHALGHGEERVSVRTGASLIASGECRAPSFLKLDVEGEEGAVLDGLGSTLPLDSRLLIAVHSAEADRKCCATLDRLGFDLVASSALTACRTGGWKDDPDLLCLGPGFADRARVRAIVEGMEGW